jgi:pimeloyl-ACP methyl ester carboxylesterase
VEPIEVRRYAGAGAGDPVVVLHGGPGAPGSAAGLARELAGGFEVWEPLQRRSGEVELTVDRHIADLRDVAPDAARIVGHSWGAMLGLAYAARHPDRVRALVLVGCGTYDETSRVEFERRFDEMLGRLGQQRRKELRAAMEHAHDVAERDRALAARGELAAEVQSFELLPESDTPSSADAIGHEETWRDVLRRQAAGVDPQSFTAISAPVLMLHGNEDPHPGPMIRDRLRRYIPQLEYRAFARCGHEPWRERHAREQFLDLLRAWLASR